MTLYKEVSVHGHFHFHARASVRLSTPGLSASLTTLLTNK